MRTFIALLSLCLLGPGLAAGAEPATPPGPETQDPAAVQAQLRELFFDAARDGHQGMLQTFIEAHYDLNVQDTRGYTGLILAAYHGHLAAVEQLIAAGADPCREDARGNTALMGAIFKGEVSVAKRLLQAPCSPDQRNHSGQTAAMYAALFQRQDILDALAAKGADLDARDALGNDARALSRGDFQPVPRR